MFRFRLLSFAAVVLLASCQERVEIHHHDKFPSPTAPSAVQGEVGNGGHGIKIGEKIYVYDLWESGLENGSKVKFEPVDSDPIFYKHLYAYFVDQFTPSFPGKKELVHSLARRFILLSEYDPILALSLCASIKSYVWSFTDLELREINLPDPVHKIKEGTLLLLANRSGRIIYLFNRFWKLMDVWNQVALVLHEAVYSMLPPQRIQITDTGFTLRQNGKRARQIVSILSGLISPELFRNDGFRPFIDTAELPLGNSGTRRQIYRVSSTLFSALTSPHQISLAPGQLALIGEIEYQYRFDSPKTEVTLTTWAMDVKGTAPPENAERINEFCKVVSGLRDKDIQVGLNFNPNSVPNDAFELRFANYQENSEIKQYIAHSGLNTPQFVSIGHVGTNFFFQRVAGDALIKFGPAAAAGKPADPSALQEACETRLKGTAELRNFFFPAKYPLDPSMRYGI